MSHRIHLTEGIVLGSKNFGEASRVYFILTPDFGLIAAHAQGVRRLNAKLRGHLSLLTQAELVLIRGRQGWRLIGAQTLGSLNQIWSDNERRALGWRIAKLLQRLLPEAEGQPALFLCLKNGFARLEKRKWSLVELKNYELKLVGEILQLLGYLDKTTIPTVAVINQALIASQL